MEQSELVASRKIQADKAQNDEAKAQQALDDVQKRVKAVEDEVEEKKNIMAQHRETMEKSRENIIAFEAAVSNASASPFVFWVASLFCW